MDENANLNQAEAALALPVQDGPEGNAKAVRVTGLDTLAESILVAEPAPAAEAYLEEEFGAVEAIVGAAEAEELFAEEPEAEQPVAAEPVEEEPEAWDPDAVEPAGEEPEAEEAAAEGKKKEKDKKKDKHKESKGDKGEGKKRKLCKLAKGDYLKKHLEDYKLLTLEPSYICGKCGRTAKDKKRLHVPIEL